MLLGTDWGRWALRRGQDVQKGAHTTASTSASSLPGLLMREDEGPRLQPLGRERDRTAVVCRGGDVGSPPAPVSDYRPLSSSPTV